MRKPSTIPLSKAYCVSELAMTTGVEFLVVLAPVTLAGVLQMM